MESILSLLAVVLIPSVVGCLTYFVGRFAEKEAPKLILATSMLIFTFFAVIAFNDAVIGGTLNPLYPIAFLLCSIISGYLHKKSGGSSLGLIEASLFMFFMSGLTFLCGGWITEETVGRYYAMEFDYYPSHLTSAFLLFSFLSPMVAASYLLVFRSFKLRPGMDKRFDD